MPHGWSYNPFTGTYVPHWSYDEYSFVFHPKLLMTTILQKAYVRSSAAWCEYQKYYHKGCPSLVYRSL